MTSIYYHVCSLSNAAFIATNMPIPSQPVVRTAGAIPTGLVSHTIFEKGSKTVMLVGIKGRNQELKTEFSNLVD